MTTHRQIKNVPPDKVTEVVEDFRSEGCQAQASPQADGNFTVDADCPDPAPQKPAGG